MVNGIAKFVREVMPTQEEEKASEKPAAKQDQYRDRHQQVVGTPLLWNRDNGLALKYRSPKDPQIHYSIATTQ